MPAAEAEKEYASMDTWPHRKADPSLLVVRQGYAAGPCESQAQQIIIIITLCYTLDGEDLEG